MTPAQAVRAILLNAWFRCRDCGHDTWRVRALDGRPASDPFRYEAWYCAGCNRHAFDMRGDSNHQRPDRMLVLDPPYRKLLRWWR